MAQRQEHRLLHSQSLLAVKKTLDAGFNCKKHTGLPIFFILKGGIAGMSKFAVLALPIAMPSAPIGKLGSPRFACDGVSATEVLGYIINPSSVSSFRPPFQTPSISYSIL